MKTTKSPALGFIFLILFVGVTSLAVLFNIPVLRQVLSFLFLTLVPGFLIIAILKLNKLALVEKFVLSVGGSLFFLMSSGLLINWIYPALGYTTPLSTNSLIISFSVILLTLCVVAYKTNREAFSFSLSNFQLTTTEKAFLLLPSIFPLLSICGTYLMNATSNNIVLMLLLFLIPAYAILVAVLNRKVTERIFPPAIFLIGISLLLMVSLRSSHIIGMDSHYEYYLFQLTSTNLHWGLFEKTSLDACLSISLLPTIYQSFLSINPEFLFKILYVLIIPILPIVVYIISKRYISGFYAFFASFFFLSLSNFIWTVGFVRSNMGVLFVALAIMVLSHDKINEFAKRALFIMFAISVIFSYYTVSYILLFTLLLAWIGVQLLSRMSARRNRPAALSKNSPPEDSLPTPLSEKTFLLKNSATSPRTTILQHPRLKKNITITTLVLFSAILFLWYSQLAKEPFNAGVRFIQGSLMDIANFLLWEARAGIVQKALRGYAFGGTVPESIDFVISWLTVIFTVVGLLVAIRRVYRTTSALGCKESDSSPGKSELEYLSLSLASLAILVFSIVFPSVSRSAGMYRIYFQMMALLSVFAIIGSTWLAKYMRVQPYWLLLVVLIPYFMCSTGTMYQIFNIPRDMTLNSGGNQYDYLYIHEQESYAARWLRNNGELENTMIFTDLTGDGRLISQGKIPPREGEYPIRGIDSMNLVWPAWKDIELVPGYIYLRCYNVTEGKLQDRNWELHSITEYAAKFAGRGKIYNNGGSEVWGMTEPDWWQDFIEKYRKQLTSQEEER